MNEIKLNKNKVRQQYSLQFKDQAVERAVKDGIPRVAKDLGIKESLLYYWRAQKANSAIALRTKNYSKPKWQG